jgi:hypothetical protein
MLKRSLLSTIGTVLVLSLLAGLLPGSVQGTSRAPAPLDAGAPHSPSLLFVENAGQFAHGARFLVRGALGADLWLARDALWWTVAEPMSAPYVSEPAVPGRLAKLQPHPRRGVYLKLTFVGANTHPRLEPFDRQDTVISYFLGKDPSAWRAAVPVWGGVRYRELYPGIDLEISGAGGQYVQRLVAHAGADLGRVRLRVEGARSLALSEGRLHVQTAVGPWSLPLFQLEGPGAPAGNRGLIHPRIEGLDVVSPLSLDSPASSAMAPQYFGDLRYSTYLGGAGTDFGSALASDDTGSLYVAGYTLSLDFPTTPGAYQSSSAGEQEAFLVKLNPSGTALTYATFLGGSSDDAAADLAVDASGNAYLTGDTLSANFPTTEGAWDRVFQGYSDAFVVKLNATGTDLVYSTLLGGAQDDDTGLYNEGGLALVLDGEHRACVGGWTPSKDFPVTDGVFQEQFGGDKVGGDAFLAKLNTDGSDLLYSTYLGGSDEDSVEAIALGAGGTLYAIGRTASADFPSTTGAYDEEHNGGRWDAFVAKINDAATGLVYSTFVGGSKSDGASAIALNASGDAFVTGGTNSLDFPTSPGAFDQELGADDADGFVIRINAGGSDLVYSTLLGGSEADGGGYAIDVDGAGYATVAGSTASPDFPTTPMTFSAILNGTNDAFVTRLEPDGTDVTYSTFLGGRISEAVTDLSLASDLLANLAGFSYSSDFPTTSWAYQRAFGGFQDAFVSKMRLVSYPTIFLPLIVRND